MWVELSGHSQSDGFDRSIECIYRAIEDERYWREFLEYLRARLRFTAATFSVTYCPASAYSVSHYVGLSKEDFQEYLDKWVSRNPWRSRLSAHPSPLGVLVPTQELTPDEELMTDECWLQFLAPRRMHYGFHAVLARDQHQFSSIHGTRATYLGPLSKSEMEWIQGLLPHLVRAVSLHAQIARLRTERDALLAYFHSMQIGVMLVDQNREIRFANEPAEAILAKGCELTRRDGRLIAVNTADHQRLAALILRAGNTFPGEPRPAGTVTISRTALAPLLVHVAPSDPRGQIRVSGSVSEAIVWTIDPAVHGNFDLALLQETFGLTASEARLCAELVNGLSVKDIATRLKVSIPTIRTHLAHALEKTETRRQSELVTLILRAAIIPQQ